MKYRYDEVYSEWNFTDFVKRLIELKEDGVDYEIHLGKGVDNEDVAILTYFIEADE
jgi:hypothetical protein